MGFLNWYSEHPWLTIILIAVVGEILVKCLVAIFKKTNPDEEDD